MIKKYTLASEMVDDHALVVERLSFNTHTDHLTVSIERHSTNRILFKGKRVKVDKEIPNGMDRHHIAYHFDDPMKGTVNILKGFHAKLFHCKRSMGKYTGKLLLID